MTSLAIVGAAVGIVAWREFGRPSVVALALAAMLAAYASPAIERWLKGRRVLWLLVAAASAGIVFALVGSTLDAGWSPIDDHEIMGFLGAKGRVRILDIPILLMDTEVGRPGGTVPRYRPSYYAVRLFETALWGDSPRAWYAAHMAMFAASVALAWRFFTRWIGLIPAAMLVLYMLTYDLWADIWARLGAGEVYCVLGTTLCLEGTARLVQAGRLTESRRWGAWAVLGLGAWLAMGSKENFVVMLGPLFALGALLWRRGLLKRTGVTVLSFLTLYGALIVSAITISLLRTGVDVYQNPVTAAGRLRLMLPGLELSIKPLAWWHVSVTLIAAIVMATVLTRGPFRWRYRPILRATLLAGGLMALYASQFAFYNGEWPVQTLQPRYRFPGVLSRLLLLVTAAVAGLQLLRRFRVPGPLVRAVGAGLVAILAVFALDIGWASLTQTSRAQAAATRDWTSRLEGIAARLRRHPERPVVIVSHAISDFEPIFAIPRFLTEKGVKNPLFLVTPRYRADVPLAAHLARTLDGISQFGAAGYVPLERLPTDIVPFAIGLSGQPPPGYEDVGSLWPMRSDHNS